MAKTAEITLGGEKYVVHRLNIRELEKISDVFGGPAAKVPFAVLRIALERAEPKVPNPDDVEATTDEVAEAVKVVLELAGLKRSDADPSKAATPGAA